MFFFPQWKNEIVYVDTIKTKTPSVSISRKAKQIILLLIERLSKFVFLFGFEMKSVLRSFAESCVATTDLVHFC